MQNRDSLQRSWQQKAPGGALVTGAGTRVGKSLARGLAQKGYHVAIHYNSSHEGAHQLAQELLNEGYAAAPIQCNLENRAQRAKLIDEAARTVGPLTLLVNNASIYEPDSVETLDEELWDRHFALHTEAPLFLARDFARQLPADTEGNIVNIIDARVFQLTPSYTSYTLSKAALHAATTTMAQSLSPRIRVNAIGPGPTLPYAGQTQKDFKERVAQLPLQRHADPQDIFEALAFILNAKAMTGQMLALDGGSHLTWPKRSAPTPRRP